MNRFTNLTILDLINLKIGEFKRFKSNQAGIYKDYNDTNIIYFCSYSSIILNINIKDINNNIININYNYIKGYRTTHKQVTQFINMLMDYNPTYQFNITKQTDSYNFKYSSVNFAI